MPSKTGTYIADQTLSGYVSAQSDETASGGPYYYLFVRPDAHWYLMRRSFALGVETVEYIRGDERSSGTAADAFSNRASITGWGTYDKIF